MTELMRVNDEVITTDDFVKILRLTGRFDELMDDILKDKLTAHAARQAGLNPSEEEVQERADRIRRVMGLHRAADMNRYLDSMDVSLEEFETFVTESILHDAMMSRILSDDAVEEYFKLNSPKFDTVDVHHIVVESEGKARELAATLEDAPEMMEELAKQHSIADTKHQGGHLGKIPRGALHAEVEAKAFQADEGTILGPFQSAGQKTWEIFRINSKTGARLDLDTLDEVRRLIREQWFAARAGETSLEAL